jgi:hypothetical protein
MGHYMALRVSKCFLHELFHWILPVTLGAGLITEFINNKADKRRWGKAASSKVSTVVRKESAQGLVCTLPPGVLSSTPVQADRETYSLSWVSLAHHRSPYKCLAFMHPLTFLIRINHWYPGSKYESYLNLEADPLNRSSWVILPTTRGSVSSPNVGTLATQVGKKARFVYWKKKSAIGSSGCPLSRAGAQSML